MRVPPIPTLLSCQPKPKTISAREAAMAETAKKYRGHVVVMPYPVQGHLNPMIQFAKRLASKGVKTTVAATSYTVSFISTDYVTVEPISDGFECCRIADPTFSTDLHSESFKLQGSETLTQVIQKYKSSDSPVDCLVYDSFLPWGLDVARRSGIIAAAFFTNNVTVCSVLARVSSGAFPLPIDPNAAPFLIRGLPPLNFDDLPSFITRHRLSHPALLRLLLGQFPNHENADWLLVNSFQGLEAQDDGIGDTEAFPGNLIGPMIPSAYLDGRIKGDKGYGASLWKPLSEECMEWLETKPPRSVIFVSFGSFANVDHKQVHEVAFGLKESNFYILWVIKEAQIAELPDGFVESTKDKALMVPWCNQLEILAHEATGCFLTHCGWNSTLEGLSLGVPMVGMPQWSDQQCDAMFIEEVWKIGYRPKEDGAEGIVKREEILRCLKGVMEGESSMKIRENSKKWKELAKGAMSEGGSSDKCIEQFVSSLNKFSH